MTLSDYLLLEIEQAPPKPTMKEWLERAAKLEPVEADELPEVTIRRVWDTEDPRDAE